MTPAFAQEGVADLATESGKYILTQGVLGAMLVVTGLVLGAVIVALWRELRAEQSGRREDHAKIIEIVQAVLASNAETIRSREDQNRILEGLATSLAGQAAAFKHMGEMQALQTERILEKLK